MSQTAIGINNVSVPTIGRSYATPEAKLLFDQVSALIRVSDVSRTVQALILASPGPDKELLCLTGEASGPGGTRSLGKLVNDISTRFPGKVSYAVVAAGDDRLIVMPKGS